MNSIVTMKETLNTRDFSHALKSLGKITYWKPGKFWLVTDYNLAKNLLANPTFSANRTPFFIRRMPDVDPHVIDIFLPVVQDMMVMSDGENHHHRRRICFHAFKPFMRNEITPLIQEKLNDIVSGKDVIDFARDVAEPISIFVLSKMFGIPEQDQAMFFRHAKNMTLFFGGATEYNNTTGASVNISAKILLDYFLNIFSKNHSGKRTEFVQTLLDFQDVYDLSSHTLAAQAIMMFVAGQVTTTDQICNNAFQLMTQTIWPSIAKNPDLLPAYVREATRLDPAVTFLFRVATDECEVEGHTIHEGDAVFISNHAVNRSEYIFDSPDLLNPQRPPHAIMSYGFGSHYCIGEKLGTLQIETIIDFFLKLKEPFLLIKDKSVAHHYSLAFSGFKYMPMHKIS